MIIAPRLLPFYGLPVVRFGPKSEETNPQRLPGPPYPPQNRRFRPEKLKNSQKKPRRKTVENIKIPQYCLMLPNNN